MKGCESQSLISLNVNLSCSSGGDPQNQTRNVVRATTSPRQCHKLRAQLFDGLSTAQLLSDLVLRHIAGKAEH